MKLVYGMLIIVLAQLVSYIQLQGQGKWQFFKDYPLIIMFLGLPIGYLLINSTMLTMKHMSCIQIYCTTRIVNNALRNNPPYCKLHLKI